MKSTSITVVGTAALLMTAAGSANAGTLYAAEVWGQERLTTVDRDTAQQTTVGLFGSTFGPFGMTFNDDNGQMYLIDQAPTSKGLYTVSLATGAATRVGAAGALGSITPRGLAYDNENDVMYTSNLDANQLYSLDLTTGVASLAATFANFGAVAALAYDNVNDVLYGLAGVVVGAGSGRHLVSIDPTTGIGTSLIELGSGTGSNFRGLTYDFERNVLWTHNNSTGFLTTIDPVGGAVTPLAHTQQPGASGTSFNALAFVPAPGPIALTLLGASVAIGRRRRA